MGAATANGARRATEAAQKAIASPLLEAGAIDGARGILINITGSASLKLAEVQEACTIIQSAAHEDANIIFGAVLDEKMKDAVKITVIATGFKDGDRPRRHREEPNFGFVASREADRRNDYNDDRDDDREPPAPVVVQEEPTRQASSAAPETIALDNMRDAMIANFEQSDLDVPAFLRKRNDTM